MILSDVSVRRPVLATVLSLLLVAFGLVAFDRLPLREYPDIDPPVVSVETRLPRRRRQRGGDPHHPADRGPHRRRRGHPHHRVQSQDGRSKITIEFAIDRDIDGAANDIRDRVSGILDQLPVEAEPPDIQKVDSNEDVIMWLNLVSDRMTVPELTDYARRYLVDRFSVLDGVARVRVGGDQTYAMRVWLDRNALAARGLTVGDIEAGPARGERGAAGGQCRVPQAPVQRAHRAQLPDPGAVRAPGGGPRRRRLPGAPGRHRPGGARHRGGPHRSSAATACR
jgi:multidrug efflux pump